MRRVGSYDQELLRPKQARTARDAVLCCMLYAVCCMLFRGGKIVASKRSKKKDSRLDNGFNGTQTSVERTVRAARGKEARPFLALKKVLTNNVEDEVREKADKPGQPQDSWTDETTNMKDRGGSPGALEERSDV